ncbi:unnamed protein product [Parnassius mnemosyne]|uniref:Uncharacterized protein n=1 Tax=Parnassius mnemosyne TaxID=213953 RepID=A0AAV1KM83_9NEOP
MSKHALKKTEHEERVLRRAARPAAATPDGRLRLSATRAATLIRTAPSRYHPPPPTSLRATCDRRAIFPPKTN